MTILNCFDYRIGKLHILRGNRLFINMHMFKEGTRLNHQVKGFMAGQMARIAQCARFEYTIFSEKKNLITCGHSVGVERYLTVCRTVQEVKIEDRHVGGSRKHFLQINTDFYFLFWVEGFRFSLIKYNHTGLHGKRFLHQAVPDDKKIARCITALYQYTKHRVFPDSLVDTESNSLCHSPAF